MKNSYKDIRSRIVDDPIWFDEHGVPRYCEWQPGEVANIYAREVALVEIACQYCGTRFLVAWSRSNHEIGYNEDGTAWVKDAKPFDPQAFHYGDPPNAGCCDCGPTMTSEVIRVVECWRRENFQWVRQPEKEMPI